MFRSPPVKRPYRPNSFGDPMMPERTSESAACPKLAPRGMITRAGAPCGCPEQAAATTHSATSARRMSVRNIERMLEQNRRRHGVDITLSAAGRFAHLFDCTQGCRRGITFIIKTNGHAGTFRYFRTQFSYFGRPIGLVALSVERKAY